MNITKAWWFLKSNLSGFLYGNFGKHSYMGKPLFVQRKKNVFIGNNVRIYPGLRAELSTETARIIIGDHVSIGQNFHVVSYSRPVVIGNDTTISGNVFISNVDHGYKELEVHVLNQIITERETEIGNNCFIGYGAVILPGTKLGKQCIVGANSVVRGEFLDCSVIVGSPARVIKRYDSNAKRWISV